MTELLLKLFIIKIKKFNFLNAIFNNINYTLKNLILQLKFNKGERNSKLIHI